MTPMRALLLSALIALALPVQKVDVFGYYMFDGKAPAGFTDIDHLHLSTIDEKNGEMVTVPLYGFIRMKARMQGKNKAMAVDHHLVDLKLDGKKLAFATKPDGGVSYRFAGTFSKLGNFPKEPPQGVILQGHLVKMQGEKKAAEADVRFVYEAGG